MARSPSPPDAHQPPPRSPETPDTTPQAHQPSRCYSEHSSAASRSCLAYPSSRPHRSSSYARRSGDSSQTALPTDTARECRRTQKYIHSPPTPASQYSRSSTSNYPCHTASAPSETAAARPRSPTPPDAESPHAASPHRALEPSPHCAHIPSPALSAEPPALSLRQPKPADL